MMQSPSLEPAQQLPCILDYRARSNPNGIFAKIPRSATSYGLGYRAVTNAELSAAVNRVSWLMKDALAETAAFPTIAYLGPWDLRYTIVFLAGIKVGYTVCLSRTITSNLCLQNLSTYFGDHLDISAVAQE